MQCVVSALGSVRHRTLNLFCLDWIARWPFTAREMGSEGFEFKPRPWWMWICLSGIYIQLLWVQWVIIQTLERTIKPNTRLREKVSCKLFIFLCKPFSVLCKPKSLVCRQYFWQSVQRASGKACKAFRAKRPKTVWNVSSDFIWNNNETLSLASKWRPSFTLLKNNGTFINPFLH